MKVCVATIPSTLSQGIHRVSRALEAYAPAGVRIVPTWEEADLVLLHVIGIAGVQEVIDRLQKPHCLFMYCTWQTGGGTYEEWGRAWYGAKLISSYYDLEHTSLAETWFPGWPSLRRFNLHRTPLGVDTDVFRPCGCAKQFLVGTSGYVADQECLGEWGVVSAASGQGHFHLGPTDVVGAPGVTYVNGIPDGELAKRWSRCRFVSGLRRVEGFELPAYEGLACGARPVMFRRDDAIHWMQDHAEYVDETTPAHIIEQLRELVRRPPRPVTDAERAWVRDTFSWARFAKDWWERVL